MEADLVSTDPLTGRVLVLGADGFAATYSGDSWSPGLATSVDEMTDDFYLVCDPSEVARKSMAARAALLGLERA